MNDTDKVVRRTAAGALGQIGDASAVPALIEALKDREDIVRSSAAFALCKICESFAVPTLGIAWKDLSISYRLRVIEALDEIGDTSVVPIILKRVEERGNKSTRGILSEVLGSLGDSDLLPRKIIADARFSPQQRINMLDRLQHLQYKKDGMTLTYIFPETRILCEVILSEGNEEARQGAQTVLNWLNGERDLVIASQPSILTNNQGLVVAYEGSIPEAHPETDLRSSEKPQENVEPQPASRTILQRMFGKRK